MARADEVINVAEERRSIWLAGQIDEVEQNYIEKLAQLATGVEKANLEMAGLRRVLVGLLVAIIVAMIGFPVGLIWAASIHP